MDESGHFADLCLPLGIATLDKRCHIPPPEHIR
jgi:hypothetical protein